jgi:hypothetical protein
MLQCEIVLADDYIRRGERMIRAMAEHARDAGVRVRVTRNWEGAARNLMTYGLGHPQRKTHNAAHLASGGRMIGWDIGYWDRSEFDAGMRLTIDHFHPWRLIKPEPPERFDARGVVLRSDCEPDGPILLCGLGVKQRMALGIGGQSWEMDALRKIRRRWPDRRVVYRPKRPEHPLPGCTLSTGTIEEALRGVSLLVCAHSNVAVDACIAGVPVICEDGAAFALYRDNPNPTRAQRLEFLRSLAWWQWRHSEARAAWEFIKPHLID